MSNDIKKIKIFNKEIDIDNIDIDCILRLIKRKNISDYKIMIGGRPLGYFNIKDYDSDKMIEISTDSWGIGFIKNKLRYIVGHCNEDKEIEMIDISGNNISFFDKFNVFCMLEDKIKNIRDCENILVEDNKDNNYCIRIGKVNEKYFMCLEILR